MNFLIENKKIKRKFNLIYEGNWFCRSHSMPLGIWSSILINDLGLDVDDKGRVLSVSGYFPLLNLGDTNNSPENYEEGEMTIDTGREMVPGICYRFSDRDWPIFINEATGWICIGSPELNHERMVEFVPDCVASLDGDQLKAVWLHPKNWDEIDKSEITKIPTPN